MREGSYRDRFDLKQIQNEIYIMFRFASQIACWVVKKLFNFVKSKAGA